MRMKVALLAVASVIGCSGLVGAQISKLLDNMTNPKVTLDIEHPPALPLRVTRVAFGESKGNCASSLQSRVEEDFVANGVDVLDRTQLDSVIAEYRLQGSAMFDQKAAVEVGKLLGAQALIHLEVFSCGTERKQIQIPNYVTGRNSIKFQLTGLVKGSLRTTDLTSGRVLAAKRFEGSYSETAEGGYPAATGVLEKAELVASEQIHALFFPWNESKTLIFYDDKDCNLKAAHALLRGQDFPGAARQSAENLEACKSVAADKPKLLSRAYYNLGLVHFLMGEYDNAITNLTEATKLHGSEFISSALADCRRAKETAEEMARYETDQAAFLENVAAGAPAVSSPPVSPTSKPVPAKAGSGPSVEERLKQLDTLLQKGLITKDEYSRKRAQILAEL